MKVREGEGRCGESVSQHCPSPFTRSHSRVKEAVYIQGQTGLGMCEDEQTDTQTHAKKKNVRKKTHLHTHTHTHTRNLLHLTDCNTHMKILVNQVELWT